MLSANVMEVYNRIVQCSQPKFQMTTDQKAAQNESKQVCLGLLSKYMCFKSTYRKILFLKLL